LQYVELGLIVAFFLGGFYLLGRLIWGIVGIIATCEGGETVTCVTIFTDEAQAGDFVAQHAAGLPEYGSSGLLPPSSAITHSG